MVFLFLAEPRVSAPIKQQFPFRLKKDRAQDLEKAIVQDNGAETHICVCFYED